MPKRYWLLIAALVIMPWTELQTVVAIAAWVAPVLLLRFSRTETSTVRAWLLVALVYLLAGLVQMRGQFLPVPTAMVMVIVGSVALVRSIPYVLDRWLNRRLRYMSRSLVFPVAMTSMEFLATRFGPYGSWGATGYSQYYDLPLIQIVSITGLAGLTFLVHWLAPVVNGIIEEAPEIRDQRWPLIAFGVALVSTLAYGGIRLGFAGPDRDMVTVAAVVSSEAEYRTTFGEADLTALARADDPARRAAAARFTPMSDSLLAATERSAGLGAKIIAWPEYVPVMEEDRPALLEQARALARRDSIYLMITPLTVRRSDSFPYLENVALLIDPEGEVRWRYPKAFPVVGMETDAYAGLRGPMPVLTTPYGRLSVAICQDLDFPWFIRRAGVQKPDMLIGPADDWPRIRQTHAQMEVFRAVEYGFSLLRPTNNGISLAVDPYGRVRAMSGSSEKGQPPMLSALPMQGVFTLYSRTGDWFAWCSLALMIGYIALMGVPLGMERKA